MHADANGQPPKKRMPGLSHARADGNGPAVPKKKPSRSRGPGPFGNRQSEFIGHQVIIVMEVGNHVPRKVLCCWEAAFPLLSRSV